MCSCPSLEPLRVRLDTKKVVLVQVFNVFLSRRDLNSSALADIADFHLGDIDNYYYRNIYSRRGTPPLFSITSPNWSP